MNDNGSSSSDLPARKTSPARSARRRSREFALQGLYQWLVSGAEAAVVDAHIRELDEFGKCDSAHFDALLHGCIAEAASGQQVERYSEIGASR